MDADAGPNNLLNFPVITAASVSGGSVSVSFQLDVPAGSYRIEFFKNPTGADPLGYGEGHTFVGFKDVTHPGGGAVAFTQAIPGVSGDIITATTTFCTDGATCAAFGSTSEFSATRLVTCCSLGTTTGSGTITVTSAGQFEMVFNTLRGGGIDDFFDLAEDPTRVYDLAGRDSLNLWGLFHSSMEAPATVLYTTGTNSSGAKLDLLEATATRVKVRQESFYQRVLPATAILPGVKGIGDYSVYGQRVALRWNRRVTATVPDQDDHALEITVHKEAAGVLNPMGLYSQGGSVFPAAAGDDFVLAQREVAGSPGARTDFLGIQYTDWPAADSLTASLTGAYFSWRDTTDDQVLGAGLDEKWNFLVYYKPPTFLDNTDTAVTTRSSDYRTHPAGEITINGGKGSQWSDAAENTAAGTDWFNEAEASYPLRASSDTGARLRPRRLDDALLALLQDPGVALVRGSAGGDARGHGAAQGRGLPGGGEAGLAGPPGEQPLLALHAPGRGVLRRARRGQRRRRRRSARAASCRPATATASAS